MGIQDLYPETYQFCWLQCEEMEEALELNVLLPVDPSWFVWDVYSKCLDNRIPHFWNFPLEHITVLL